MTGQVFAYTGAKLFDGIRFLPDRALIVADGTIVDLVLGSDIPGEAIEQRLDGGTIAPGFVDLQVNGGGGMMFNDDPSVQCLKTMAASHASLGATSILPTLITDTPAQTKAAIEATDQAIRNNVAGIVGLHLEGPHLSLARKGAHDPTLIRPMTSDDLAILLRANEELPVLKVTLAPESATPEQIEHLASAGVIVSLGHTNADYETCRSAVVSGARCVTHLFNAMSQLGNREPGLVGAALELGELDVGLIADLIHVHPAAISLALSAKEGPGEVFLVSDAMATAGSDISCFCLNGREIHRASGRLTLEDGTLAGADLDLATAVWNLIDLGVPASRVLAMATSIPARVVGLTASHGSLSPGREADFVHLGDDGRLLGVWQNGAQL